MTRKLLLGIGLALIATSAQAESIHWAGPPNLPPPPTTVLSCPAGARLLLMIEDTKQVLYVWINGKLAFIVSPTWPHPSSPAVAVAQPGGYVGARPPATMDLTPLTGSADAHVFVRTNLNDQPNGGAKLHGYIGCDRWQATITEEGHPRDPGNVYKQVYVLKHNKL